MEKLSSCLSELHIEDKPGHQTKADDGNKLQDPPIVIENDPGHQTKTPDGKEIVTFAAVGIRALDFSDSKGGKKEDPD